MVGGILIRRALGWTVCGEFLDPKRNFSSDRSGPNMVEINRKITRLDSRNLAILRNRIENLVVPLSCTVDYSKCCICVAVKIANLLNLKPHFIRERST